MTPILQNRAVKSAIQQIAVRTERQDPKTILDSFYDCNIIEHLKNVNHQIIQGRRGTGKTHILHVLQNELESDTVHCIFFDCKATGSAGEIANENVPLEHRAIQLMRDFLFNLYTEFTQYFKNTLYTHPNRNDIELLLDHLHKECFSYEDNVNTYEDTKNSETKVSYATEDSGELSFPSTVSIKLFSRREKERGTGRARKVSGTTYRNIVFPNIYKCVDELSKATKTDFVLLVDEWSNLPLSVQPNFAEFLRCCFMPSSHFTVKIAAVEARTNYFIKKNNIVYGMEIGADIIAIFKKANNKRKRQTNAGNPAAKQNRVPYEPRQGAGPDFGPSIHKGGPSSWTTSSQWDSDRDCRAEGTVPSFPFPPGPPGRPLHGESAYCPSQQCLRA